MDIKELKTLVDNAYKNFEALKAENERLKNEVQAWVDGRAVPITYPNPVSVGDLANIVYLNIPCNYDGTNQVEVTRVLEKTAQALHDRIYGKGEEMPSIDIAVDVDEKDNLISPMVIDEQVVHRLGIHFINKHIYWIIRKSIKDKPKEYCTCEKPHKLRHSLDGLVKEWCATCGKLIKTEKIDYCKCGHTVNYYEGKRVWCQNCGKDVKDKKIRGIEGQTDMGIFFFKINEIIQYLNNKEQTNAENM
jgi:hypothetical protein